MKKLSVLVGTFLLIGALATGPPVADAQSVSDVISKIETGLSELASSAQTIHRNRCNGLSECATTEQCSIPACGSSFPGSQGFGCVQDFGTNDGLCGSTCSGLVRSMNESATRYPNGVSFTNAEVQAFTCSSRNLKDSFVQQRAASRLEAWQYIGHDSGSIRIFPASAQERSEETCTDYDARLRPWYTSASSGPKDIVLVLDRSASMDNDLVAGQVSKGTRMAATITAAKALLDTLTPNDNIGIVTFSDTALVLGTSTSTLQRATAATVTSLKTALDNVLAGGGTKFVTGFERAFTLLNASNELANCNKVVLFLTDGKAEETEATVLNAITTRQNELGQKAIIFTYTLATQDRAIPQAIACANNGVWANIDTGLDPLSRMKSYFQFLAQGIDSTTVRWTSPYTDAFGLGTLVTAALPVYDRTGGVARIVGVVGADVRMSDFPSTSSVVVAELFERSRTCVAVNLTECETQHLRNTAEGEKHVCPAPARTIASCASEIVVQSECNAVTGGLNSLLCSELETSTLLASTNPLSMAEVACCSCGGSGKGKVGSDAESEEEEESSNGAVTAVITIVIVATVVGVIVVVCLIVRNSRKEKENAEAAAQNNAPAHEAPSKIESALAEARRKHQNESGPAAPPPQSYAGQPQPPSQYPQYPQQQQQQPYPPQQNAPPTQQQWNGGYPQQQQPQQAGYPAQYPPQDQQQQGYPTSYPPSGV